MGLGDRVDFDGGRVTGACLRFSSLNGEIPFDYGIGTIDIGRQSGSETRSLAQEPACKDLGRNGQKPAITPKDAYTPAPNRASSRSKKMHPSITRRVRTRYHLVFYFAITVAFRNLITSGVSFRSVPAFTISGSLKVDLSYSVTGLSYCLKHTVYRKLCQRRLA